MSDGKLTVNRPLVGVIAIVCLCAALGIGLTHSGDESWVLWQSGFTRVGLVMAAFWFALPSPGRQAAWANMSPRTGIAAVMAVVALAVRPKAAIPVLIVLAIVGLLLRPRPKRRPKRPPH